MLRALKYRNYRLFFSGQVVSLIGTWITTTATNWLVYRLTGSALLLGVVGFAGQFPAFLARSLCRHLRRPLESPSPARRDTNDFDAAVVRARGARPVESHHALGDHCAERRAGLVNAFDMPARQAFLLTMIENRDDLGNAIALNSSMVNLARLLGPSIAGVVIAATSEGWCFLIDGVSYVAVIVALLRDAYCGALWHGRSRAPARFISSGRGSGTRSGFGRSARSSCSSPSSASSACPIPC